MVAAASKGSAVRVPTLRSLASTKAEVIHGSVHIISTLADVFADSTYVF